MKFFDKFLKGNCQSLVCGQDCRHCMSILEYIFYKQEAK